MSYSICDDCKYVKYSFDGGSTKCGYHGKKDCNFTPREKKDLAKDKVGDEDGRKYHLYFELFPEWDYADKKTAFEAAKAFILDYAMQLSKELEVSHV